MKAQFALAILVLLQWEVVRSARAAEDALQGFRREQSNLAYRQRLWQQKNPTARSLKFYRDAGQDSLEAMSTGLVKESSGKTVRGKTSIQLATEYSDLVVNSTLDSLIEKWTDSHPEDKKDGHLNLKIRLDPNDTLAIAELLLAIKIAQKSLLLYRVGEFDSSAALKLKVNLAMLKSIAEKSGVDPILLRNAELDAKMEAGRRGGNVPRKSGGPHATFD